MLHNFNKKHFQKILFLLSTLLIFTMSTKADEADPQDDWLHVNDKAQIVDKNGKEVWLTGINWFGFNTGTQVFDGVWTRNMHDMFQEIADHGFNLLRVPLSVEIVLQWKSGKPDTKNPSVDKSHNPELLDENGDVLDSFGLWSIAVKWCKELGIKIMPDIHCTATSANGHINNLWYDSDYSTEDWITALEWIADYYKNDDTIIALDLKNEPHGKADANPPGAKWDDSTDANNWKYAAEQAANRVLKKNPNLLILVEGIEVYPKEEYDWTYKTEEWGTKISYYYFAWWGGNFRGVKDFPIDLGSHQSQLVYSPHDYGPLVYDQPWFHDGFTKDSVMEEYWEDNWFFICENKIAPLLIGEWGGFLDGGPNEKWLTILRDLMIENHIHHTFWCFNQNSGDTGGLIMDNFSKWDEKKYALVKPALWQKGGKFVSLDHKVPLGANGISLSDA